MIGVYQTQIHVLIAKITSTLEIRMAITMRENVFGSQINKNVIQGNGRWMILVYLLMKIVLVIFVPYDIMYDILYIKSQKKTHFLFTTTVSMKHFII